MRNIKSVNEFFGKQTNEFGEFSKDEEEFIQYMYDYRFKDVIKTSEEIPSKFLGITYKKRVENKEIEIYYNDFSVYKKTDDAILISSGNSGSYRPEGYFWGDSSTDEKIKSRLEKIVSSFNNSSGKKLTVRMEDGYYLVGNF